MNGRLAWFAGTVIISVFVDNLVTGGRVAHCGTIFLHMLSGMIIDQHRNTHI